MVTGAGRNQANMPGGPRSAQCVEQSGPGLVVETQA